MTKHVCRARHQRERFNLATVRNRVAGGLPSGRLVDSPAVRRHPKSQSRVRNVVTFIPRLSNVCLVLDVVPHSCRNINY
jgi:hypothetical protein